MENNYDNKIENIKKRIEVKYLQELIKQLSNDGSNYHLNSLQNLIINLKNDIEEKKAINQISNQKKSKANNIFDNLDQYMFNKPWNRLPEVHKLIKMKEYINKSLIIYDNEKKNILIKKVFAAVKQKKLTRKGSVNYDQVKGRIVAIPSLKYDKNKEEYYLKL